MVLNPDKCHFLTLGFNKPFSDFSFENNIIKNVIEEKILGIVIDNNLILNDYELSFDSLLSTLNEKTIYQRCMNVY